MKTIITIFIFTLFCNFSFAGIEPRGVKFNEPIKGLLLAGKQNGRKITGGVVFLAENGTIYAADSAAISEDGRSMIFKGKPFTSGGERRMFTSDVKAWMRVSKGDKVQTSKGKWQMVMPAQ